jgi:hypothetical protein
LLILLTLLAGLVLFLLLLAGLLAAALSLLTSGSSEAAVRQGGVRGGAVGTSLAVESGT